MKADEQAFAAWLLDQYRGETTAGDRIEALRDAYTQPGSRPHRVLSLIAKQERVHARWIAGLLESRGITPKVEDVHARYWSAVTDAVSDLDTGAAVGAHAEKMRLERIEAIASDTSAPNDVRAVFQRILPQERFHERAFRSLTSTEALARTAHAHQAGRELLGLAP